MAKTRQRGQVQPGRRRVTLDVTAQAGAWQAAVKDTGLGIPQAHRRHLSEPFNRLGRAEQRARVGVGPVLSSWLVQAMGGQLKVEGTEGEGSTFSVTLPAA